MSNESENDDEAVVKAFDAGADAQIRQLQAVSRCAALILELCTFRVAKRIQNIAGPLGCFLPPIRPSFSDVQPLEHKIGDERRRRKPLPLLIYVSQPMAIGEGER